MLDDPADGAARGAGQERLFPVFEELLADAVEHGLERLIQHAIAQELVVADFEQEDIGLEIAVGRDDDRAFPIHESQVCPGVAHARTEALFDLGLVEEFALGTDEARQGGCMGVNPLFRRGLSLANEQDVVFLEQSALAELRGDGTFLQGKFHLLARLQGGGRERVIEIEMEFGDLDLSVKALA